MGPNCELQIPSTPLPCPHRHPPLHFPSIPTIVALLSFKSQVELNNKLLYTLNKLRLLNLHTKSHAVVLPSFFLCGSFSLRQPASCRPSHGYVDFGPISCLAWAGGF
ncbi:S ribonuclease [Pyrus ussuriensis x Pyrus communis]|uniref:S ribonuclease n=1 Tax=Pyrus ussuriensis x Pyrus communis TaxID=2448454 RepID=A0A5N5FR60_9ROSA|nr:S ribonuclease [Pyrus ussuriensis x Pyrus communis]